MTDHSRDADKEDFRLELLSVLAAKDGEVVQPPPEMEGPAIQYVLLDFISSEIKEQSSKSDDELEVHPFSSYLEVLSQLSFEDPAL